MPPSWAGEGISLALSWLCAVPRGASSQLSSCVEVPAYWLRILARTRPRKSCAVGCFSIVAGGHNRRRESRGNLGLVFFFGLLVEDGAFFDVTACRTHIGVAFEPNDRHGQVFDRVY
jgi:hypothetical protein